MGFAGNNDPQYIIPSSIATREAPSATASGISGRVGGQVAAAKRGGLHLSIVFNEAMVF